MVKAFRSHPPTWVVTSPMTSQYESQSKIGRSTVGAISALRISGRYGAGPQTAPTATDTIGNAYAIARFLIKGGLWGDLLALRQTYEMEGY